MRNFLKALVLLFIIFVLPILIVSLCTKAESYISDYEDTSLDSVKLMPNVEWGLKG